MIEDQEENNLKIMIKLNESESGNISYFKSQLEESFHGYKVLEDKVGIYKQKLKQMESIKCLVEKDNQKKAETILYLEKQLLRHPSRDKRISFQEGSPKGEKKLKEKVRYTDSSVVGSVSSSVSSHCGNGYLRCEEAAVAGL